MPEVWFRTLLICDDVRFEVGGAMTLVGVYTDQLFVEPEDGALVLPRLAFCAVVAGLSGASRISWRKTLTLEGSASSFVLVEGSEPHDVAADEHRLVHFAGPLALQGPGRYRLTLDLDAADQRRTVEHRFSVELADSPQS
jgi:hypothetical protein